MLRRLSSAFLLVALAVPAGAQEDDPLVRAVREQEALREKQAQGIRRAEDKAYTPFAADTMVSPGLQASGSGGTDRPAPRAAPASSGAGVLPWAIAGTGVLMLAVLGWAVLRRNRH
jgi:hypothetical protein